MRILGLALLVSLAAAPSRAQRDFDPAAGGVVGQIQDAKKRWNGAQANEFAAGAPAAELPPEDALRAWAHSCPAIAAYRASSHSPAKRGLGVSKHYSGGGAVIAEVGASWYYTWTAVPLSGGTGEFVPLLQYPHNEGQDIATLKKDLGALPSGSRHLLGFNEPDIGPKLPDPPTTAAAEKLNERLLAMLPPGLAKSVKIGSPALASPILYDQASRRQEPNPWLKAFMDDSGKAASAPGRRVDFIAAHLYAGIDIQKTDSPEIAAAKVQAAVKGFLDRLHALEQAYPDKEIWITEMGLMDKRKTEEIAGPDDVHFGAKDDACFMAQTVAAMDADPRVARYAWFNADEAHPQLKTLPSSLLSHGKPTPLALLYKQ